jgi:hypothetical protein
MRQYRYIVKLLKEKPHLKPLKGAIVSSKKGQYAIRVSSKFDKPQDIRILSPENFLKSARKAQALLQTSWFG